MSATDLQGMPRVGILGGGQLGRMLALAAVPLGVKVSIYQAKPSGAVDDFDHVFTGDWRDAEALEKFLEGCTVVTLENEWADLSVLAPMCEARGIPLWPAPQTMAWIRDKTVQKRHAEASGLPLAPFEAANSPEELAAIIERLGLPLVLKSPTHGYDGYGTATAKTLEEAIAAHERLAREGQSLVEAHVPFIRELSVLVARRPGGETVSYPVVWTVQEDHRCVAVELPAPSPDEVQARAQALAVRAAEAFEHVGIMAVELFECADGSLYFNELAPRPHNSGHFTIEACESSQFDNHLRAILDWPLGSPRPRARSAVMLNILGDEDGRESRPERLREALCVEGAHIHVYGKRESRPARKMGHITAVSDDLETSRRRAQSALERIMEP